MNLDNPVLTLCIESTRLEFAGCLAEAQARTQEAWQLARTDYERCVAAHYVARYQTEATACLHWNQVALHHANLLGAEQIAEFYPSLYINLGHAHEQLGHALEAEHYYQLAAELGLVHYP